MNPIRGLIAAPFTPVTAEGELDEVKIHSLAVALASDGVSGVFVAGTTGEGISLSGEQRRRLAATWRKMIQQEKLQLRLIVHVGHLSLREAQGLARHAEGIGTDAIACLAPCFFKPEGVDEVVDWCRRVASVAAKTPFLFYHMPGMTGVPLKMTEFVPVAIERIPTFAGIKFTHTDFEDYAQTVAAFGDKYSILSGPDELLLDALRLGAKGAVGTSYNFAAPLFLRLIAAFQRGDEATAALEQERARRYMGIWSRLGVVRAGKAMMSLIGRDCGPVLPPLLPLSPEEMTALRTELHDIGFFEWYG